MTAVERAAAAAGLEHLATLTQAEFLVGAGTDELLRAIQSDPATSMEAYLEVRSALMRMLDPAAMGRFRVMAFGRDWPAGPPLAAFAYRLPERPRRSPTATPAANEPDHTGLGRCTYCRPSAATRRLRGGRARPDGERRANLHARSARAAPRRVLHGPQLAALGPRRPLPDPDPPAASARLPLLE